MDNPFDKVKVLNRYVDFIAESHEAKIFKKDITKLIDTSERPDEQVHCIVGDYGSGKSHVNHHILESARRSGDILAIYVSVKELLDLKKDDETLYGTLLKQIIVKISDEAEDKVAKFVDQKFRALSDSEDVKFLEEQKNNAKSDEQIEQYDNTIKTFMKLSGTLRKEDFFEIIDEMAKLETFKEKYKRTILIIDELEILARDRRIPDLEKVVGLREEISLRSNLFWVFSCVQKSYEWMKTNQHSADMFGQHGISKVHFIPNYQQEDRKHMIFSRMDLRTSTKNKNTNEKRFPFSKLKFKESGTKSGNEVTQILTRPELSPRVLMGACKHYLDVYNLEIKQGSKPAEAFEKARSDLFETQLFNIINPVEFKKVRDKILKLFKTRFPTALPTMGNDPLKRIENVLKDLFKDYLVTSSKRFDDLYGFDDIESHRALVDAKIQEMVGGNYAQTHSVHGFLSRIEEKLRTKCLVETYLPDYNADIFKFNVQLFQPLGKLPHTTTEFHEYLCNNVHNELIETDNLEDLFKQFLESESKEYSETLFTDTKNDLLETEHLEKNSKSNNEFRILKQKRTSAETQFRKDIEELQTDNTEFNSLRDYVEKKYFGDYLKGNSIELLAHGINSKYLQKKVPVDVFFWEAMADDADRRFLENDFSLVICGTSKTQMEVQGYKLKESNFFHRFEFSEDGHKAWILIPNDEIIDQDKNKVMTFKDWLYWNSKVNTIATKHGYQEMMSGLYQSFESDRLGLMEKISSEQ